MPEDSDYYNSYGQTQQQMAPPPVPQPTYQPQYQDTRMQNTEDEDEEEQRIRERAEARQRAQQAQVEAKGGAVPMKIKENYVPLALQRANKANIVICPNCNTKMPAHELAEHMRSMTHSNFPQENIC